MQKHVDMFMFPFTSSNCVGVVVLISTLPLVLFIINLETEFVIKSILIN